MSMTVKELVDELKQFPPQALIIMANDEEGNAFFNLTNPESNELDGETVCILYPCYPEVYF